MIDLIDELTKDDSQCGCLRVTDCSMCPIKYKRMLKRSINKWLNSFNTDSATVCFTAIQELKKAVSENEKTAN